jgi:hypothetical protein
LGTEYNERGDLKKAKFHYEAVDMAGCEAARCNLGNMEEKSENLGQGLKHMRNAASDGDHQAFLIQNRNNYHYLVGHMLFLLIYYRPFLLLFSFLFAVMCREFFNLNRASSGFVSTIVSLPLIVRHFVIMVTIFALSLFISASWSHLAI